MDQLKEILRANLLTGETSALEILLTSEDFAEYLTKTQMLSSIADRQDSIIEGINGDIDKVNTVILQVQESKEQVETYKEEVAAKIENIQVLSEQIADSQAEVEAKRAKVQEKVDESNSYLSQLNSQSEEYQDMITGYETDIAEFESEISSILQRRAAEREAAQQQSSSGDGGSSGDSGSSSSGGGYTGTGDFGAPLSISGQYVSSGYYYRTNPVTGAEEHHGGLDIAAPNIYGASIYACDSGEVATATYHYSWGNYVLIDHGNGYATLYAHMSSIAVSEGQSVSKGQVIGYVGSTGYATGPHLHIEVWINGSRTDPSPYIPVG
ncbi:MAG: peptidoglycan DD-metalloendopeptidase family protein [Clostridia bacterium]|nr:peptidoglycan DD-metalloendopeptidase family protein [Clostridia bacterium]